MNKRQEQEENSPKPLVASLTPPPPAVFTPLNPCISADMLHRCARLAHRAGGGGGVAVCCSRDGTPGLLLAHSRHQHLGVVDVCASSYAKTSCVSYIPFIFWFLVATTFYRLIYYYSDRIRTVFISLKFATVPPLPSLTCSQARAQGGGGG